MASGALSCGQVVLLHPLGPFSALSCGRSLGGARVLGNWMMSLGGCHGDVRRGSSEEAFLPRDWLQEPKKKKKEKQEEGCTCDLVASLTPVGELC